MHWFIYEEIDRFLSLFGKTLLIFKKKQKSLFLGFKINNELPKRSKHSAF